MIIYNKKAAAAAIIAAVWLAIPSGCTDSTPIQSIGTAETASSLSRDEADHSDAYVITLDNDTAHSSADGVIITDNIVTVTKAGRYLISGTLNGRLIVDTDKDSDVTLILDGASITSDDCSAICISKANNAVIELAQDSINSLSDCSVYNLADGEDEPNAALYSKCDLTLSGSGQLSISGSYKHALFCKDDLVLSGGTVSVKAVKDGIKARDSITVTGGSYTVNAGEDGIRTTNIDESDKGSIVVDGGVLDITAQQDGIQSTSSVTVTNGNINIVSGGGSANAPVRTERFGGWGRNDTDDTAQSEEASTKGIKAATDISISGAVITVDSADDTVHSNTSVTIDGGTLLLSAGDDGIHADENVSISDGTIDITKSYEGVEGKRIDVSGGSISVKASDDGFNAAGGSTGNDFSASPDCSVTFNGGYTYIDADGDGIDTNGSLDIKDGTVLVNGPVNDGNGALDYAGECTVSGGTFIAAGSSGMAQMPSESSSQCSLMVVFDSRQEAGNVISLIDESGSTVLSFAPSKAYSSIVFSSPDLTNGKTYTLSSGGTQADSIDGYSASTVAGAEKLTDVTLAKTSTAIKSSGEEYSGFGGFGGGRGGGFGGFNGTPPDGFDGTPPDFSQGRPQKPSGGFPHDRNKDNNTNTTE